MITAYRHPVLHFGHRKGSVMSRSSSSHREHSRKARKYSLDSADSGSGGESDPWRTVSMPSTSWNEVNSPPRNMVMEALAALKDSKSWRQKKVLVLRVAVVTSPPMSHRQCRPAACAVALFWFNHWVFWFYFKFSRALSFRWWQWLSREEDAW